MKIIQKLCSVVRSNYHRKMWLKIYFNNRDIINNWLILYIYSSSIIVDIAFGILRRLPMNLRIYIKAKYRNGMWLYFPAFTSRYYGMFLDIVADKYIQEFIKYYNNPLILNDNDVVVDVGAHIGKFSVPIIRKFPNVSLFAFEPDPDNYKCLKKNIFINTNKESKVKIFMGVVSNDTNKKLFSTGALSTQGSLDSIGFSKKSISTEKIFVESYTLEKLFNEYSIEKCSLLKMDCEGSEYLIFKSLPIDILLRIKIIFIEVHLVEGENILMIKDLLEKNDFIVKGFVRDDGGMELFCLNSKG